MPMHGFYTGERGMMRFHQGKISEVTPPRYNEEIGYETVTLISDLKDESDRTVGRLKVTVRFDYLMQDITKLGWWQSDLACLVDHAGRYLTQTQALEGRTRLGETNNPLELAILKEMRTKPYGTQLGSGHPPDLVGGFYGIKQAPWTVIMFAPGETILAPIVNFRLYYVVAGSIFILLILLLIQFVGGKIVRSIGQISDAAEQVALGHYGDPLPVKTGDEIGHLIKSFNTMVEGLKQRDFISNTFGRYVDQEIAKELLKRPEAARLGGEKRAVAILMTDIREFTSISESLNPEATIRLLNHYFSHMIDVIQKYQGIIVDFFGDGVLVFFDPLDGPLPPTVQKAVDCALALQKEMLAFNEETSEKDLPQLEMGVGINAGEVVVGNIGSESRAKYGIVGMAVNVTNRIQAEAKGGDVVISDSVYRCINRKLEIKKTFSAALKGLQDPLKLYVI